MTTYIQQLLFEPKNMPFKNIIDNISNFMFTNYWKDRFLIKNDNEENNVSEELANIENVTSNEEYIQPKQKDSLFWCIFIAKHGNNEYLEIQDHYASRQMDLQKKICNYIKENSHLLKTVNIRITKAMVQEIISDLMIELKKTSIYVLYAHAFFFQLNIVIMHPNQKCFLKVFTESDNYENTIVLLQKNEQEQYTLLNDNLSLQEYIDLYNEKYCIENHIRPLKAMSSYKVSDLDEIAEKLDIDFEEKPMKKQEKYDEITKFIKWY
tara:strand:+ start:1519 stop:2316 length:798 start_codon:yes stop_codon:yes gene_type:complete